MTSSVFQEKTSFSGKISFAYGGLAIVANKVIILNLLGRLLINPFKLKFFQIILKSFTYVADTSYVKNHSN